ncbi:hypothetical protein GH714_012692 [Hevea brasiliensis]|uniref:Uncharacterized protein n=1 Tax=Hevea brasiliensis TaxID=3981 RepID=A0A6A6LIN1_HEVBR|nr:hypothetical protein GH714_012692 [Hevea brasiliensis]
MSSLGKSFRLSSSLNEEFMTSSSSSEAEEEYDNGRQKVTEPRGQFEIWSSIQQDKKNKEELEKPGQFDIWSSILSQKAHEDNKNLPPPYIHPLVKRSASSLSEKSLEICTESLGSETALMGSLIPSFGDW